MFDTDEDCYHSNCDYGSNWHGQSCSICPYYSKCDYGHMLEGDCKDCPYYEGGECYYDEDEPISDYISPHCVEKY